ncbi:MAG TPA: ABC transporter transmembrane domain-containing protein [Rhizobiaceae bacterium]|nr:ABC transporter transmembrane domain-containing protein [Rhizobiaceae bacterium]
MEVTPSDHPTLSGLYRAIWRSTAREQQVLIFLSLIVAVLAAVPLKFQQLIINGMVESADLTRLAWLCAGFFAAVLLATFLKFTLNYRRMVLGERAVHVIRDRLYANYVADSAAAKGDLPARGTFVAMLIQEAEAVGYFAGIAISTPLMLLGTLVSVLGFIMVSQPLLGILAIIVIAPQAFVAGSVQTRINARVGERVQAMRDASDRISAGELTAVDPMVARDFERIFAVRCRMFFLKQFVKLVLRSISAVGAVCLLFLGGWLVITGQTDVGTVVASLTGLTRIEGPWRELIGFFRGASTTQVQFGMLLKAMVRNPR